MNLRAVGHVAATVVCSIICTIVIGSCESASVNPLPPNCNQGGPYSGAAGDPVDFSASGSSDSDGSIVTYAWEFGDGTTGIGVDVEHTYASGGTFAVTLCATDNQNMQSCCATTATISGNVLPRCDPGGPYAALPGANIVFDGSGSEDPDGDVTGYAWDFGDGATAATAMATHAYVVADTYTVALRVTDNLGGESSCTVAATITANLPPTCDAGGPYAARPDSTVTFDGSGSSDTEGDVVAYAWDFGDGATGSTAGPTHVYAAAGVFTVTLCATDNDGGETCCASTATITANTAPTCDADGPYAGAVAEIISFDGGGSTDAEGTIVRFAWEFGDGTTASGATTTHAYNAAGTFTVTLTVTDDEGGASSCNSQSVIN